MSALGQKQTLRYVVAVYFTPESGHSWVMSARHISHRQRAQLERRHTGHHVQCDRALKRNRLKRDGAV